MLEMSALSFDMHAARLRKRRTDFRTVSIWRMSIEYSTICTKQHTGRVVL